MFTTQSWITPGFNQIDNWQEGGWKEKGRKFWAPNLLPNKREMLTDQGSRWIPFKSLLRFLDSAFKCGAKRDIRKAQCLVKIIVPPPFHCSAAASATLNLLVSGIIIVFNYPSYHFHCHTLTSPPMKRRRGSIYDNLTFGGALNIAWGKRSS